MAIRILALLASILAAIAPASAGRADDAEAERPRPKIYKWIDENGIAHYTTQPERIPEGLRRRTERLGGVEPALEPRALEPRAPADSFDRWVAHDRAAPVTDPWDEGGAGEPFSPEARAALEAEREELDRRIAELEAVIAADEDTLKSLISDPAAGGPLARADDAEFRSIAVRLPKRLSELRALRDRREQLESP